MLYNGFSIRQLIVHCTKKGKYTNLIIYYVFVNYFNIVQHSGSLR